jgi:transcriptional regulator with XRE-family HTH domain
MPNALQQLILSRCASTGDTLSDIAARGGLSRQTVSAILHRDERGNRLHRTTLHKLALGLELPTRTVQAAANEQDPNVAEDPSVPTNLVTLLEVSRGLSQTSVEALTTVARALKAAK